MHGLRFEYERDGTELVVIARCEDDLGETRVTRVRVVDLPKAGRVFVVHPSVALARQVAEAQLREWLGA